MRLETEGLANVQAVLEEAHPTTSDGAPASQDDMLMAVRALTEQIATQNRILKDWRFPLRNGVLIALGTFLGATLGVSLLLWMFKPLQQIEILKPALEKIAVGLDKKDGQKP